MTAGVATPARARAGTSVANASCVAPDGSHDRALHAVHRRVHPLAQDARRRSRRRRPHDPEVTPQPAIQSRQVVWSASPRSDSLQPSRRPGRVALRSTGFAKRWLAECEFQRVCRLHADGGLQEKLRAVDRVSHTGACRPDVRGGGPVALSSIVDRRRVARQRCRGERDHERHPYTAAPALALGARQGEPGHVPRPDD